MKFTLKFLPTLLLITFTFASEHVARRRRDMVVIFPDPNRPTHSVVVRDTKIYMDIPTDELEDNNDDKNPIVISSEIMDYETNSITVRQGKKLMISCVFERDDLAHKSDLNWKKADGGLIDGETSPSLFAIVMSERGTKYKKTSLHFNSIHPRDSGFYLCSARTIGGEIFEKTIKVTVLPAIEWKNTETIVGALVGEPLTVDCGVKTNKGEPMIQITQGNGEPLDESIWTIAGDEATIQNLEKEHNGLVVSCVTIEMHGENKDEEFPVVDRKDVHVEAFIKPEFSADESIQYTVIDNHDRDVYIHCNVTASYPAARWFTFFHGEEELNIKDEKYNVLMQVGDEQGAHLHIKHINENDLGAYRCEASNSKAKSSLKIHLREASAPSEPKVTLIEPKRHSIIWKVQSIDADPDMPITHIEIRHIRANEADDTEDDSEISDAYWKTHGILAKKAVNEDGLYEITGLRHSREYVWRFRQINEAGFGDSVVLRAKTFDENGVDSYTASSPTATFLSLLIIILSLALF